MVSRIPHGVTLSQISIAIGGQPDISFFVFHHGTDTVYLLLYVDDIVLIASSQGLLHYTIEALQLELTMKNLESFTTSLGCRFSDAVVGPSSSIVTITAVKDTTDFRSLAVSHLHSPNIPYGHSVFGTPPAAIHTAFHADCAGFPNTRKSTSGYACFFLGDNLVSWSYKRQNTVSRSSAKAEYPVIANFVADATWIPQVLEELHIPLQCATLVYCDNISSVHISSKSAKNTEMEQELLKAQKCSHDNMDKLHDVEKNYVHLRDNLKNLEDKISNLEDENHLLRQKALNLSPRHSRTGSHHFGASPCSPRSFNESSPVKLAPLPHNLTELRRSRMNSDRHEDYHDVLQRCIKDDMGFKKGKPVAACIIYKCLLHWGVFEAERTTIFDFIIHTINAILKTENENDILPYWLANASALLCMLQRNLRSKGFIMAPSRSSSDTHLSERANELRMSCPYTSAQNGKAERMIRTTNDASLPARFGRRVSTPPPTCSTVSPPLPPRLPFLTTPSSVPLLATITSVSLGVRVTLTPPPLLLTSWHPARLSVCFSVTHLTTRGTAALTSLLVGSLSRGTSAMKEEYAALLANQTWDLVPRPSGCNVVTGKWIGMHKRRADGTLDRYKARWVLRGFTQRPGVDYDETFSPVVKPATVRTVLSLAISRSWPVHQLDVKNAFLHGTLTETVYCSQPAWFVDPARPEMAPRAWYSRFATFLVTLGFTEAKSDTSLFVYCHGAETAYLLLYVDDIVLTASSQHLLQRIIGSLQQEFAMKDLGVLHHFLGVTVELHPSGLLLHQR
ncbi:hypothetical protein U9M48_009037 [Paspalum notatum var. saurae]|uniref:Reverse transcriptase Ty1/copia-type domain-containing protein n=1 Tax=Paspalum notatum var. saurae TaxID=547442 RepID=A0AAQ3SQJ3_PASNO